MKCPDCKADVQKKGVFYTCKRCGLTLKPWEIEDAQKRAKKEIDDLRDLSKDEDEIARKKKRERLRYRDWLEGRQDGDYD